MNKSQFALTFDEPSGVVRKHHYLIKGGPVEIQREKITFRKNSKH